MTRLHVACILDDVHYIYIYTHTRWHLPMHRPGSRTSPAFTRRARLCGAATRSCHPPGKVTLLCFSKKNGHAGCRAGRRASSRRVTRPHPPLLHPSASHTIEPSPAPPPPASCAVTPSPCSTHPLTDLRRRPRPLQIPAKEELRRRDRRRRGRPRAPLQAYRDRRQSRGERGLSRIEVKKRLGRAVPRPYRCALLGRRWA
jgi:hypothetical protein